MTAGAVISGGSPSALVTDQTALLLSVELDEIDSVHG